MTARKSAAELERNATALARSAIELKELAAGLARRAEEFCNATELTDLAGGLAMRAEELQRQSVALLRRAEQMKQNRG